MQRVVCEVAAEVVGSMAAGSWSAEAGLSTWDWSAQGARRAYVSAGVSELQPTAIWPHPASSLTALKLRMLFFFSYIFPTKKNM